MKHAACICPVRPDTQPVAVALEARVGPGIYGPGFDRLLNNQDGPGRSLPAGPFSGPGTPCALNP